MRKNKNYWLKMLLLLIIPISSVYADEIVLSCPSEINPNSEFTCEVSGVATNGMTSLKVGVQLSEDLSFVSFVPDSKWQGDGRVNSITLYSDDVIEDKNFKIGVLKLKNNGGNKNSIILSDILFGDRDDSLKSVNTISTSLTLKSSDNKNNSNNNSGNTSNNNGNSSNNNTGNNNQSNNNNTDNNNSNNETVNSFYLKDIKISGYKIDFSKSKFEYDLKIGNENQLKITPVLEDKDASYEIIGNSELETGSIIKIRITSQEGLIQDYIIKIEKDNSVKEVKENNNSNYTYIFIIIIVVLVIINVVRLIINKKKNNK